MDPPSTRYVKPELSEYSGGGNVMHFPRTLAITSRSISELAGRACTFSISPELPAGLAFEAATGTISGTPSVRRRRAWNLGQPD